MARPEQIPFDIGKDSSPEDGFEFGNIKIPKYGSLTPREQMALVAISLGELGINAYYAEVVRAIVNSRCEAPDWDAMDVPIAHLRKAFEFVIGESNEWQEPQEDATDEKKSQSTGSQSTGD